MVAFVHAKFRAEGRWVAGLRRTGFEDRTAGHERDVGPAITREMVILAIGTSTAALLGAAGLALRRGSILVDRN